MGQISHLEIYKHLQKTNCRECRLPTCLAFATAVMRGDTRLDLCPYIDRSVLQQLEGRLGPPRSTIQDDRDKAIKQLQEEIRTLDLSEAAQRLEAPYSDGTLSVRCLSKDFHIDSQGAVSSDCHTTPWLIIPLLNCVIHSAGKRTTGRWVPFRELNGGADWERLFGQRCEKPLKQVLDVHTDLFEDIIDIFAGRLVEDSSSCDISVVIQPLPKVPVLIRYWGKEGVFESTLPLFFDSTAADNLGVEPLYMLCVGLVTMFEKIALTHGNRS